jgi:hypothetical protein
MLFNINAKILQQERNILFKQIMVGKLDNPYSKGTIWYTKITAKYIKDLTLRAEPLKHRRYSCNRLGGDFLDVNQRCKQQ